MSDDEPELLNIHAQYNWHDEALIVGNREGLIHLRDAINHALSDAGPQANNQVFASDGEGYGVNVVRLSTNAAWGQPPGYTMDWARTDLNPWREVERAMEYDAAPKAGEKEA